MKKRTVASVLLLVCFAAFMACGTQEQSEPVIDNDTVDDTADIVEEVEIEVALPLYPEGTLDPNMISADEPISAVALYNSFYAWEEKIVTLQGYPYVFYGDSITIEDELELVAAFEDREVLATFTFLEPLNLTIPADGIITVSGIIEYDSFGYLELNEGQIITEVLPLVSIEEVSPYSYDGVSPIGVLDFYELFNIWLDKEVTVDGYYSSTTSSTLSSGVVVRIDLADPESRSKCVACEMSSELSEEVKAVMSENRPNTQICGVVEGESFNIVGLVNCELVNR